MIQLHIVVLNTATTLTNTSIVSHNYHLFFVISIFKTLSTLKYIISEDSISDSFIYSSYETICKVPSMVSRTRWGSVCICLTIYIVTIYYWLSIDIQAHWKNKKKDTHTFTHTHSHTHLSASQGSLKGTFLRFLGSDLDSISENHLHKIRKIEEKESHYFHPPVTGRWKGQKQKWNS